MKAISKTSVVNGAHILIAVSILVLRVAAANSYAQTDHKSDTPTQYDPKMAKRADMRTAYSKSPQPGNVSTGSPSVDHSHMVDFMNISAKRADLRARIAKVGLEAAYVEWMTQTGRMKASH